MAVYFQYIIDKPDGSGYTVVEGSELVVTREARRDNSSTYRVNDKTKTFAEVGALLRTRGIDLDHNRFLILQGEVEQIAMMKPKAPSAHEDGLLEYLEDIIGSNRLVPQIEEALKGMEECNEQRATKLNALKASEQNVLGLEGRKAEAEMYLSTEAQLNGKKSAYYQKNASQAMAFAAELGVKRDELKLRLDDEKGKTNQLKDGLAELEKAVRWPRSLRHIWLGSRRACYLASPCLLCSMLVRYSSRSLRNQHRIPHAVQEGQKGARQVQRAARQVAQGVPKVRARGHSLPRGEEGGQGAAQEGALGD